MHKQNQGNLQGAFSTKSAAEYLDISESYLRQTRMVSPRKDLVAGPKYFHVGRAVRYTKAALDAWIEDLQMGEIRDEH